MKRLLTAVFLLSCATAATAAVANAGTINVISQAYSVDLGPSVDPGGPSGFDITSAQPVVAPLPYDAATAYATGTISLDSVTFGTRSSCYDDSTNSTSRGGESEAKVQFQVNGGTFIDISADVGFDSGASATVTLTDLTTSQTVFSLPSGPILSSPFEQSCNEQIPIVGSDMYLLDTDSVQYTDAAYSSVTIDPIPEPCTVSLLLSGLIVGLAAHGKYLRRTKEKTVFPPPVG